jgi:hypothetical protein
MKTYIVETRFANSWENTFSENDLPLEFLSIEDAQSEIEDLIANMPDYLRSDYRIVEIND